MFEVSWTQATRMHLRALYDLDIKCFDNVWTGAQDELDVWADAIDNLAVRIGVYHGEYVGFWVAEVAPAEHQENDTVVRVLKVGVSPRMRGNGVSRSAIRNIRRFAGTLMQPTRIETEVPEHLLTPNKGFEPSFIGDWLTQMGFVLNRAEMFAQNIYSLYGETFHHNIRYSLPEKSSIFNVYPRAA